MNIAQVAPHFDGGHLPGSAGTGERLASFLTGELVAQGHDVTFYATPESPASYERRLTGSEDAARDLSDSRPWQVLQLEQVFRDAERFDVVHFHDGIHHLPLARRTPTRALTTLYRTTDSPGLAPLLREFGELSLVSVSDAQRRPVPWARWVATIPPGLPENLYRLESGRGSYLAYMDRIAPDRGIEDAIEIARRVDLPLRIAGTVHHADSAYFESCVRPMLSNRGVQFEGGLAQSARQEFLGGALALLVPLQSHDPIALGSIEALACGTPVIAYRRGVVPEIVDPGVSGQVVTDIAGAVAAVESVEEIDRWRCRRAFEQRFLARRMATEYLSVYERLAEGELLTHARSSR